MYSTYDNCVSLFEGYSEKSIEIAMNNIYNNLKKVAYHQSNSHAFLKHSDKTDEYLLNRINFDGCEFATSYYSPEVAKDATYRVLVNRWRVIQNFLMSKNDRLTLHWKFFGESLGFGYSCHTNGVFEDCYKVIVVLQKDVNLPWGFHVLTTYPIITNDLVADETVCEYKEV